MQRPPPLELEPIHTTATAPAGYAPVPSTQQNVPHSGQFGRHPVYPNSIHRLIEKSRLLDQEYQARALQLAHTLEQQLATTRLEGSTHPLPAAESIIRELGVRNTLIARTTAELHRQTALANTFYGHDPLGVPLESFYARAVTMERPVRIDGMAMQAWVNSYRAAHEARLLTQSLQLLNHQQVNVRNWLASVQASDQARNAAREQAERTAAEQARIKEQARLAALAEAARLQKEQQEIQAREQARLTALAETQRLAAEQAHIAAEAAARQIAAEQARLQAQADVQRRHEERRLLAEKTRQEKQQKALRKAQKKRRKKARKTAREQARRQAENALKGQSPVFANAGSMAAFGPNFTGPLGVFGNNPATTLAIRTSLRTAISLALAGISTAAAPVIVGFAALLVPSELGNGDLFAASVPLSELAPDLDTDLYELATTGGEVDLPVRLGSRTSGNRVEVVVVSTDGVTVPSKVPVVLARFDVQKNTYISTANASDSKGPVVTWTPLVKPLNPSTDLPVADTDLPNYEGADVTPDSGRIDPFPQLDQYGFDGWVTVFPIDSGIPPIFTIFRDRRQDPGIASGIGQTVSGNWLGTAATQQGAPIPTQIADKLRGREFSSFRAFRKAFWKAVGNDQALFEQFTPFSKFDIKNGLSPTAPRSEQVGRKTKLDIHHVVPIAEGGSVYDLDNLRVLTPKRHIETHSEMRKQKNEIQE
ncbi:S-type pyocin domain-containing protein [Pseudomonas sp. HS6]|uniref:S-type pyocin domain-containing protein n=1 Tax=Pseudomonas sp. HS6 TaxID=2850559 RepID=UPI0020186528|nr:S-type pyocin domain-containing protein [Pseudomonas sp. HS6]UQS15814.1 S-type pyocin domain-containing protein [Pseudomonas sp. HS6]